MKGPGSILFLSHGGGPLPLLGDPSHREMVAATRDIVRRMPKPSRIVIVSAHWECPIPTVNGASDPGLLYDYGGFPPESYQIQYPAPGDAETAQQIVTALQAHGFDAQAEMSRGLDHGVFVPLKLMYPDADVPCIQISLIRGLDPLRHRELGAALADVLDSDTLLLGSGSSFHNLRVMLGADRGESRRRNEAFEQWLIETCGTAGLSVEDRAQRLDHWFDAPYAAFCHPRPEHLIPLHVCAGAAGQRAADQTFVFDIMGLQSSAYLWLGSGG